MDIVFIHPDLGIGGAERLVVDAALSLKKHGNKVRFVTAHHDPGHCFPETNDGTFEVTVVGDWLPRNIYGRFAAVCAYIRMCFTAIYMCYKFDPDIVFCDQISACIPFIRILKRKSRILFYCHHPDQLLTERDTFLKKIYRLPLDWLEQISTGMAHCVLVNSRFTGEVFRQTFKRLSHVQVRILYPTLNTTLYDSHITEEISDKLLPNTAQFMFLSVNRFERKKNIRLAILAFDTLLNRLPEDLRSKVHLIIAGGYDLQVQENVEYCEELILLAEKLGLSDKISFSRSPSDPLKKSLIDKSLAVIYTPTGEHFGIVPIEAMYCRKPVVAVKSGGPKETVVSGTTGFLVDEKPSEFAKAMQYFVESPTKAKEFGNNGRQRVYDYFIFNSFALKLQTICVNLVSDVK